MKSCLHIAVENMKPEIVQELLNRGAFIDHVDRTCKPPIYYAAKRYFYHSKAKAILKILLKHHPKLISCESFNIWKIMLQNKVCRFQLD